MNDKRLARSIRIALLSIACLPVAAVAAPDAAPANDPAAAPAQDTPAASSGKPGDAANLDTIQVTGYAGSLIKSVADKRNAEGISDTISAEDVGKMPEANMAESLQRITGVQITRSNGEGQYVSLRGLDPKFTSVLYNGREMPSASGGRAFDFTILTSGFVSSIETLKTPTADLPEGGVAGTVNVHTIRPLDMGGTHFAATAEGVYDNNAKGGSEPHFSMLYSDTFADNTLGWVIGGDYGVRKLNVQEYQAFGMQPTAGNTGGAGNISGVDSYKIQNATNLGENIGERTRTSFMSMLQYRPNENLELRLDGLYSRFKNNTILPLDSLREVNVNGSVNSSVIDPNGNVVFYDANGIDNRNNARSDLEVDTLKSIGLGGTLSFGGWKADGEVSYAKSKHLFTDISLEVLGRASAYYDLRTDPGKIPTIGYDASYDPMDPNNYNAIGVNGNVEQPTTNQIRNAKLNLSRDLSWGWINNLEFGVDYRDQQFGTGSNSLNVSAQQIAQALGLPYNATLEGGSFNAAQWMQLYGGSGFMSGYDGGSTFPKTWLAANPYAFLNSMSLQQLMAIPGALTQNVLAISTLEEKASSAFVKMNFASEDSLWSGNFGVRFVRTEETSTGYVPDLNSLVFSQQGAVTTATKNVLESAGRTYSEILPSFNLRYELADDWVARFGAARVMQRPDLNVLAPTTSVSANVNSITMGNPNVSPYLANQFDVSLEWYFNKESLLSFAAFYKDAQNFIVQAQHTATYNVTQQQGGAVVPTTFTVNQPANGSGVKLKGFELGYQQPFSFLPEPFKGFGAQANYTYVDAGTVVVTQGAAPVPVSGVSKNTYNAGVYFENPSFGARLLYNYRGGYVSDPLSYFGDGAFVKGAGYLDFSANYNFTKNFSATFQVLNINNTPIVTVNNVGISRGYELDGRRYTLGLHANF
jgi:iron complex outermembrane recepter protein